MADLKNLTEDYATRPVPQEKTYSGVRVGFVLGGIGVALPALLSGSEVGVALGYEQSMWAFIVAAILVTGLAILSGWVGMRSRLSTYMILKFSFGREGARVVNLTFALAQFGWFGVNAYFFGAAAESVGQMTLGLSLPSQTYILFGGVLMTAATVFGFKALDKLALFVFPLMIATLAFMTAKTFVGASLDDILAIPGTGELSFGQAITVLAGGIIVGVLLVPDLTRYARGPKDVVIAMLIALAFIEPLVHVAASGPALRFGEIDPLALMLALGLGVLAFIFLILASVTTNAINLYGSGLSLASVFPRVPEYWFVIAAGVIGTCLAALNISELFMDFLIWQSVIFSSVLGVYVVDFFLVSKGDYSLAALERAPAISWAAFAAWGLGAITSALTFTGQFNLTGMSNLDGVIVAALLYFALKRGLPASVSETA
ncbi:MAG: cytosine permease [Pseudomonadota bacterium]